MAGRRPTGPRPAASAPWSASTTAGSRPSRWPVQLVAAGRIGEIRHVRRQLPAGLAGRPGVPADLAAAARAGRLGGPGRPGRARRGPGPVPDRAADLGRLGGHRHVRARAPAGRRRGPYRPGDRGRRRRCSPPGSARARWPRSRRPGSPPGGRTRCGSRSTASRGSLAFDLERLNELRVLRRHRVFRPGRSRDRGVPAHPGHRAGPSVPVRLVAAGARAGLGAHVHPPGPRPGHRDRRGRATRRPRSPTGCRSSASWPRSRPAPRTAAGGRRSDPETFELKSPQREPPGADDVPTVHVVHRPMGRPAAGRGGPAGPRLGLRRPGAGLLG